MNTKLSNVLKIGKDEHGMDAIVPREDPVVVLDQPKRGMSYLQYCEWCESLGRMPTADEWASFHMEQHDEGPQAS